MSVITVWTKQNRAVLEQLEKNGRFVADERYMRVGMEEHFDVMRFLYRWLAEHMPNQNCRPADAQYPVWVSFKAEDTMLPEAGYVILELQVEEELMTKADINKWGTILNYSYIPCNEKDAETHRENMKRLGVDDAKAVMTPFYPLQKQEIIKSWDRLFDDRIHIGGDNAYGLLWEVRKEWIRNQKEI